MIQSNFMKAEKICQQHPAQCCKDFWIFFYLESHLSKRLSQLLTEKFKITSKVELRDSFVVKRNIIFQSRNHSGTFDNNNK